MILKTTISVAPKQTDFRDDLKECPFFLDGNPEGILFKQLRSTANLLAHYLSKEDTSQEDINEFREYLEFEVAKRILKS